MKRVALLFLAFLVFIVVALIYKAVVVNFTDSEAMQEEESSLFEGPPEGSAPGVEGPSGPPPKN